MKFDTVSTAFNYYKDYVVGDIEKRAQAIGYEIDSDPNADVDALNVELDGLKEAKANIEERATKPVTRQYNPITGGSASFDTRRDFGDNVTATPEYRSGFFKSLLGQDLNETERRVMSIAGSEKRADQFNILSNSAAVLPETTLNEIVTKAGVTGGLFAEIRKFNIPANLAVPIATPGNAAEWHEETTLVDREKADLASVIFNAYELMKVFSLSAAVRRMSVPAFEGYIVDELSRSLIAAISDAIINGTGVGQPTGILAGVDWDTDNSFALGTTGFSDLATAITALPQGYHGGAKFAMSPATLYGNILRRADSTGQPFFIQNLQTDSITKLLGFDVVLDGYIPTDTVIFGNFQFYGLNMPQGIAIERSTDSGFRRGVYDYRALAICDGKPLVDEAFVKLEPLED